jgi:glycine cleavage system aminomethyltransferase T
MVLEAGGPHGLAVVGPCHIRRIEGGILAYGADMSLDTTPYDVGMGYEWMVDLEQKADFIGKNALARTEHDGPRGELTGCGRAARPCHNAIVNKGFPGQASAQRSHVTAQTTNGPPTSCGSRVLPS